MINELDYDGINFPLSQKHYNKVEKRNSIRINVFGYEDGQPFPIHISKETFEDQMNLLLITKDERKHYVLIKDFNAFMYNQSKHKERKHFCIYCLQCFSSERILANHCTSRMRSQSQLRNDKYIMMQYTNWINSTPSQQWLFSCIAQWLEHWVCNPGVASSSLTFGILTVNFSTGTRSFCVQ